MDIEGNGSSVPGTVEKSNSGREPSSKEGFRKKRPLEKKDKRISKMLQAFFFTPNNRKLHGGNLRSVVT
jgi:hypothetical protein